MSPLSNSSVSRVNAQSLGRILVCAALTALGARIAFLPPPITHKNFNRMNRIGRIYRMRTEG